MSYELEPASVAQVQRGQDGELVEISGDVGNVVADLRRLDPSLRVRAVTDRKEPFFVVYQLVEENGRTTEHLVLTAKSLDQRIVKRVEEIMDPSYNFADALETNALKRKAESRNGFREKVESHADRLLHAAQKDLGIKPRIFVP